MISTLKFRNGAPIRMQGEGSIESRMACYTVFKGHGSPGRSRWEVPFLAAIHSVNCLAR